MREKILFKMPQRDLQLAALCILQEYEQMKGKDPAWSADFHIMGVDKDLERFFVPTNGKINWVINREPEEISFYFEFDETRAYRISDTPKYHVVRSFAIMLGCEPPSYFPDLRVEESETSLDFLILYKNLIVPDATTGTVVDIEYTKFDELMALTLQSKIVVGSPGLWTYIAASLGKIVIEIYPDDHIHPSWLAKFMGKRYYQVKESALRNRPNLLIDTMEVAWRTIS